VGRPFPATGAGATTGEAVAAATVLDVELVVELELLVELVTRGLPPATRAPFEQLY